MAAPTASNVSADVITVNACTSDVERGEAFMQVTKSSPKEPSMCLDHTLLGHEDASSIKLGSCGNAMTTKLAGCRSYDQTHYVPFADIVVETASETLNMNDTVNQSVCQTGDDIHKSNAWVGCGGPGVEFSSQPVKFTESKLDASAFVCSGKHTITEEAEFSSFHEIVTEQIQEKAIALIKLECSDQQCLDLEQQYILKPDASHDNSFNDKFIVNSTHKIAKAELKSTYEKSERIAKNSFGDSDFKSEVITQNSKLSNMISTLEEVKLKSEIGHGDTLGGDKNETLDTDLFEITSAILHCSLISEVSCVCKEQDVVENKISGKKLFEMRLSWEESTSNCGDSLFYNVNKTQAKMSPEKKSFEKEHCEFIPVNTSGDRAAEKNQITPDAVVLEKHVHKERYEIASRIHDSIENKAQNFTIPTLVTKGNQELSAKMIVTQYVNEVQGSILPEVIPNEELSESDNHYSRSITRIEQKKLDGRVSEIKLAQENVNLIFLQGKSNLVVSERENSNTGSNSLDDEQAQELIDEKLAREMLIRRQQPDILETSIDKPVLETLTFSANKLAQNTGNEDSEPVAYIEICVCPLCDRAYTSDSKDVLAHLVLMHKFVIADVKFIANLPAYLRYWKTRFDEKPISEFCSKIVTNIGAKDQAPKEEFYLLCDALPEDKSIREHLQRKKLESILAQQQNEREETQFCRQCLFCKQTFCGNRAVLFDHLLRDHTFHVGQPDNLVYTDELFDLIQSKLENQLCLFCEKSFKDKASLREHMRKKQHRKINPKNKEYDRFYIVNYMEMGKNWESLQSEDNRLIKSSEKDTDEEEWSGWNEESESKVVCLFCDSSCVVQTDLQQHMKEKHSFDLLEVNNKLQLNFYQKVKLINYIRRQVYHRRCYGCQQVFEDKEKLHSHFSEHSDHIKKIPDAEAWDQPQYFFPTYEDDCLLCQLDDDDEGAAGDALGVMVIAETIPVTDTILKDQKLCCDLLQP
ncbi:hypothetical protein BsWGS_13349 [Bradybaena similaris]